MTPVPSDLEGAKPALRAARRTGELPATIETDVVVVGAGASGLAAATAAATSGLDVVVLEAADEPGGTTVKSAGGFLIFDNRFQREAGYVEDRDTTLRLLARTSFPDAYDPGKERLGLEQLDWDLITTFYDRSSEVITTLEQDGVLTLTIAPSMSGDPRGLPSYFTQLDEEEVPFARTLNAVTPDGIAGWGRELIRQLLAGAERQGAIVLTGQRVSEILRDADGDVAGVETTAATGGSHTILARHGVIFATGGFGQNRELLAEHMPGLVMGSCAASTIQGDFLTLAQDLDVDTAHLHCAWWGEVPAEMAAENPEVLALLFYPYGDSMIYVDRHGKRVLNEKAVYDQRGPTHFVTDEQGEQPNRLLFMIYDSAVANEPTDLAPTRYPVPVAGQSAPYVIEAPTLEELEAEIGRRLEKLASVTDGFTLGDGWAGQVSDTIRTFNGYATKGVDPEFGRGTQPIQADGAGPSRPGSHPNPTMYPMSTTGPYYCIITAAGVLDTKGGPRVNPQAQVLRPDGTTVPRLYGAGNCVASPAANAYWSGGNTLGIGITFGYIAGEEVSKLAPRTAAVERSAVA